MTGERSREVRALRSLYDLITQVNAVQDLHEVLQTVAQGVVDVLGFQVAVINSLDPHGFLQVVAVAGDEGARAELLDVRTPVEDFLAEFEIADQWGGLRYVPHDRLPQDVITGWIPDVEPLDVPDAWHPLDALYAPLCGPSGDLVGVLAVDLPSDRRRPGPLRRKVLEMYAVQAGLAIHHAQERQHLADRVRLDRAVRTVLATAASDLDLDGILASTIQPLVEGFRCERIWLRVFATEGESVSRGREVAHPEDMRSVATPILLDLAERTARTCWAEQRTSVVAELGDTSLAVLDPEERDGIVGLLTRLGASSLMEVPLGAGAECLGYLVMLRSAGAPAWTDEENDAALELGREIGRAVLHARMLGRERQLVGELQELDRYKGELIATITHELKNPLTSILGHVELLQEAGADDRSVRSIGRNAERLRLLAEDLLLLAKVKDPNRPFIPAPVDLSALVGDVCDLFAVQAGRRDVTVCAAGVEPGVHVLGDRDELERALVNVVGNAVKYTGVGGHVRLALHRRGDRAEFRCADTGIGISAEDQRTLFEEFDRSSNPDAHAQPGSGLGLAIVKRIVDRHHGVISVHSARGEGATFSLLMPAAGALDAALGA